MTSGACLTIEAVFDAYFDQVNGFNATKSLCRRVESLFLLADDDCTKLTSIS